MAGDMGCISVLNAFSLEVPEFCNEIEDAAIPLKQWGVHDVGR